MMRFDQTSDLIVVGGGHAGVEAALAGARLGASVLLLTQSIGTVGQMSCNPAIGGIGKSHLVAEIDALGGIMARAADLAGIQFRTLNSRKGPAVQATRAQTDRLLYLQAIQEAVFGQPHLFLLQQSVVDLVVEKDRVVGVVTQMGLRIRASAVVLTTGTFLGGRIHIGLHNHTGGRAGEAAANPLAERLGALPLRPSRLKTGTPPRIDGTSVDFSVMEPQPGDEPRPCLSKRSRPEDSPRQIPCHITQTSPVTHEIIRSALDESPLYRGDIRGPGPRYCPSIEDKVVRFADRTHHQIFVEPEGLRTTELYPNGISTSLPFKTQVELVRSIRGFEEAHITRPGYAIEYTYLDPRDLEHTLQSRVLGGLFMAGQINGTTGYEEAAAQGLVAGLNAARLAAGQTLWEPAREDSYTGVMIDDLVSRGVLEPYRMFTSRAEYRLRLRQDNADFRLTPTGRDLGLVNDALWAAYQARRKEFDRGMRILEETRLSPQQMGNMCDLPSGRFDTMSLLDWLKRPQIHIDQLAKHTALGTLSRPVRMQLASEAKYADYVKNQERALERTRRAAATTIPQSFRFDAISGLSNEQKQRLQQQRPGNLAAAARLPGMTPAAVSLLAVFLKKAERSGLSVE